MRLRDPVAPRHGGGPSDHRPRPVWQRLPGRHRLRGQGTCSSSRRHGPAPLHSVINYCRHYRDRYGSIDIVYGSRSKEDLVDFQEILDVWCKEDGINVHLTIDREQPDWDGHVGFVPNYVKELGFDTRKTVVMCGPPIMIKFTLAGLMELGFDRTHIYTTMELKMKCALGKCGRCNIGATSTSARTVGVPLISLTSCPTSIAEKDNGKNGTAFPVRQKI